MRRWAIAAFVAAVYVLLWHRLLAMAALDFEAIIVNQYEQQAADLDVAPVGRWIIRLAGLPVLLLATTRVGLALGRAPAPWRGWGPAARLGLAVVAGLAWIAFCVPFALSLTTWIAVEAFEWVEFHGQVDVVMDVVYAWAPAASLPGLLLVGAKTLRPLLGDRSRAGGWVRLLLRGAGTTAVVAAFAVLAGVFVGAAPQAGRVLATDFSSQGLYEARCDRCHFGTAPITYRKTPAEWARNVARMQAKPGSRISPEEARQLTDWLSTIRAGSDAWAMKTHCFRCHGSTHHNWSPRTAADWQGVIARQARWSPHFLRPAVQSQLMAWLEEHRTDEDATLGLDADTWAGYVEVIEECSPCHSVGWNAEDWRQETDRQNVVDLVERMSQKIPGELEPDAIERIADHWMELIADEEEFERLVPHDRPEPDPRDDEEGWFPSLTPKADVRGY